MDELTVLPPTHDSTSRLNSLVAWTQLIYALHAFSLLTGILGAATVVVNATTQDREIPNNATICCAGQTGCSGSAAKFGWYLNLPGAQEQVIFNPALVAQALTVNSIVPALNSPTTCTNVSDTGFTYVVSAMTGGAFNQVFLPPSEAAEEKPQRDPQTKLYLFPDQPKTRTLFRQLQAGKLQKLRF